MCRIDLPQEWHYHPCRHVLKQPPVPRFIRCQHAHDTGHYCVNAPKAPALPAPQNIWDMLCPHCIGLVWRADLQDWGDRLPGMSIVAAAGKVGVVPGPMGTRGVVGPAAGAVAVPSSVVPSSSGSGGKKRKKESGGRSKEPRSKKKASGGEREASDGKKKRSADKDR